MSGSDMGQWLPYAIRRHTNRIPQATRVLAWKSTQWDQSFSREMPEYGFHSLSDS